MVTTDKLLHTCRGCQSRGGLVIPAPLSDEATNLLANVRNKIWDLTASDLIVVEVASALWKRSTLRKEISESEAVESHADFLALGLEFHSTPPLVRAALTLAAQERHSPYDLVYVTLAEQLGCEFNC
jgi:predicted nucleic acid-binding protein